MQPPTAAMEGVIAAARGDRPVDLLLTNLRLVNVFNGQIMDTAVAVAEGVVVGFGDGESVDFSSWASSAVSHDEMTIALVDDWTTRLNERQTDWDD